MQKFNYAQIIFVLIFLFTFSFCTSLLGDEADTPDGQVEPEEQQVKSDEELIEELVASYKDLVAKADAEKLLKILSSDSIKLLEKELNNLKKVLESVPVSDLDKNIPTFGKTAREILAMNIESFLSWALSRLTDWDKEDLEKAQLDEIIISEEGNSAELKWKSANINETPNKAMKEENVWKIVISIS